MSIKICWVCSILWIICVGIGTIIESAYNPELIDSLFTLPIPNIGMMFRMMTLQWSFLDGWWGWFIRIPMLVTSGWSLIYLFTSIFHDATFMIETETISPILLKVQKQSDKFREYHNNIDELLGIKTTMEVYYESEYLKLKKNVLHINSKNHDWYITDKHEDKLIFKVVGLHKKDESKNTGYLLGKEDSSPFLYKLNNKYIDSQGDIEQIFEKCKQNALAGIAMGMITTAIFTSMMPSIDQNTTELTRK
jgi:hypothetical protein